MTPIDRLYQELDEWNFAGEEATLWWRDDDAVEATPSLARLLDLSNRFDIPVGLAVIPALLQISLVDALFTQELTTVLQHGISHLNRASVGDKKRELVGGAEVASLAVELADGLNVLSTSFGGRFCPVLVPPWNRIDDEVLSLLDGIGFLGVSTFTPRQQPAVSENVWVVNTHVDIMNWKQGRKFAGEQASIDQLVRHLQGKRLGDVDRAEPTGLLTHHLVHDEPSWQFLEGLFDALDQHPAVTWLSAERAFQTRWRLA